MNKHSAGLFLIICGAILGLGIFIAGEFILGSTSSIGQWGSPSLVLGVYYLAVAVTIRCLVIGTNMLE